MIPCHHTTHRSSIAFPVQLLVRVLLIDLYNAPSLCLYVTDMHRYEGGKMLPAIGILLQAFLIHNLLLSLTLPPALQKVIQSNPFPAMALDLISLYDTGQ